MTRVTDAAGEETSPAISPDGSTVAYAKKVNGSWGIYAQRIVYWSNTGYGAVNAESDVWILERK